MMSQNRATEQMSEHMYQSKDSFPGKIISSFLSSEQNMMYLLNALSGDEGAKYELEIRFRKFYFRIRFVKYLSSTIKYCLIDQIRYYKKNDHRNVLIFDQPFLNNEKKSGTIGEFLLSRNNRVVEELIKDPNDFYTSLSNELLAIAFEALTPKQKFVITLSYAHCFQDNEIASLIGVSPQAIFKTRNLALKKMKSKLMEGGRRDE
ncbi:sigma-70 RNA polymerase sigma factor region 4 domain-containing protein [Paenibacillus sp. strain BS8-2]